VNDSEWETKEKTRCEERGCGKGQNERRTRDIKTERKRERRKRSNEERKIDKRNSILKTS
jgi:hypothetical protein